MVSQRIREIYMLRCYHGQELPLECISQDGESFPTDQWLSDFWTMVGGIHSHHELLKTLEGLHLLPITGNRLAPLSKDAPVVFVSTENGNDTASVTPLVLVLDRCLDCRILRKDTEISITAARKYLALASEIHDILSLLRKVSSERLGDIPQNFCQVLCEYVAERMYLTEWNQGDESITALKHLPIYQEYETLKFVALEGTECEGKNWRVAWQFASAEYPWLPVSIHLLACKQPMAPHLEHMLDIPAIRESEYWFEVLSDLTTAYPENEWDRIIFKFGPKYHVYCQDHAVARPRLCTRSWSRLLSAGQSIDVHTEAGPSVNGPSFTFGALYGPRSCVSFRHLCKATCIWHPVRLGHAIGI